MIIRFFAIFFGIFIWIFGFFTLWSIGFFKFFWNVFFFGFLWFLLKLIRLLLKVTKVITGHQILPKICQNSIIRYFFAKRAKIASAKGQIVQVERSSSFILIKLIKHALANSCELHIRANFYSTLGGIWRVYILSKTFMGAKLSVLILITCFPPYLRSAMVWFPLLMHICR